MLYKVKYIYINDKLKNIILKNLIYKYLVLIFYKKNYILKTFSKYKINSIKIHILYNFFLKFMTLKYLKFILIYNFKLSKFFLPKKYSLTTVLRSPHIDKRSREQFHIIEYKASLKYPLFFSIANNFITKFFMFERGFNMVLKTKILN